MPVAGGTGCECSHARSELLCSFPRGAIEALALECQVTFELYRICCLCFGVLKPSNACRNQLV